MKPQALPTHVGIILMRLVAVQKNKLAACSGIISAGYNNIAFTVAQIHYQKAVIGITGKMISGFIIKMAKTDRIKEHFLSLKARGIEIYV
jgi:hypothetical protein